MDTLKAQLWQHLTGTFILVSALTLAGCSDDLSGTNHRHACDENTGVTIQEPTYDRSYSVSTQPVTLLGLTWADKHWYDCFPCTPDLSQVRVDVYNPSAGYTGVANDWFDHNYLGYIHRWYDYVPLSAGANDIEVTLYYNDVKDGYDCISVTYIEDVIPPSIPENLVTTTDSSSQISLMWGESLDNATTDDSSVSYRVYRDDVYLKTTSETTETDQGLSANTAYCYTVSSIDTAQNESLPSSPSCSTTLP